VKIFQVLYPVPESGKDHITIETGIAGLYRAEVLDLTGRG